ncbi:LSU ribosomal protein L15p (L27Ae) [gamma proteobacterium IMCC2047]|nr:LSU ribosomal protein L15p (L27Ae) [gamma proteobacterium IMCC2047]
MNELAAVEADVIDLAALKDANIIADNMKSAKVILSGEITKAVTLKGVKATKGAKAAIEAAGGKVED